MDSSQQQLSLPVRNAGLYTALRRFVEASFAHLRERRAEGEDVSFSVAEHRQLRDDRPFYEYRPLTERFVLDHREELLELEQAREAAWTIAADPAAQSFLRAGRADLVADLEVVATSEVLMPTLVAMAEARPDFELDDEALLEHYLRFERALYTEVRRFVAAVPVWGLRLVYGDLELAPGVTLRQVDADWFRLEWPEAAQLDWGEQAVDGLPRTILQFERSVGADDDEHALDPLGAVVHVVSAIRALAGGSVTAGPLVFERFDWRALAPRPVPALAARRCGQLPSRVDGTVANAMPQAVRRLGREPDGLLARALERYQYAATAYGTGAMRAVFDMLVEIYADEREVGSAALRMATVVGSSLPERRAFVDAMHTCARAIREARPVEDETAQAARMLAAALRATVAAALVGDLPITSLQAYADAVLLGEQDRRQLGIAALRVDLDDADADTHTVAT